MRTIKFRVFDTEHNSYARDKGDWSLGVNSGMVRGIYGEEFPEMIVEQFTGLTDKNGKEIYEGDILTEGAMPVKIVFDNGKFYAVSLDWGAYKGGNPYSITDVAQRMEVIGNIHENPELLN